MSFRMPRWMELEDRTCEHCGKPFDPSHLAGHDYDCPHCETEYNAFGQMLAPRHLWENEGDHEYGPEEEEYA